MIDVYDEDGNQIGQHDLSEQQATVLGKLGRLTVFYHTPQLMRHKLGNLAGSFTFYTSGDRVIAFDPKAFGEFQRLQAAINAMQEPENGKPDPVR